MCHFLHIFGRTGIADRIVRKDWDPEVGQIADESDHLGDEKATDSDPRPISFRRDAGTRVTGSKFESEAERSSPNSWEIGNET